MESERRRSPRYPFMAAAEVTDSESGTLLKACTSDLSSDGCYLDTINPLPHGTIIKIPIDYEGQVFIAKGVVIHLQANMGMGVTFIALETGCADLLKMCQKCCHTVTDGSRYRQIVHCGSSSQRRGTIQGFPERTKIPAMHRAVVAPGSR